LSGTDQPSELSHQNKPYKVNIQLYTQTKETKSQKTKIDSNYNHAFTNAWKKEFI